MAVGWIGTGRLGAAMARRLTDGTELLLWNRTRSKAEALAEELHVTTGSAATVAERITELASCEVVFTTVSGSADLAEVVTGPSGLLSGHGDGAPTVLVDCSTVSVQASADVRQAVAARGTAFLAAPVSGNAKVVAAGRLSIVVSGPEDAFTRVEPLLRRIAGSVTYSGDGDSARLVKICHNLLLGAVTQSLAEILVLAEKGGVTRAALLAFINDSVLGSTFTGYKTPAFVKLDYTPTFTSVLLGKDFDLGLEAASSAGVPMPVAELVRQLVADTVAAGYADADFAVLLERQAAKSGLKLAPEAAEVGDGLGAAS